tara:strand:- start:106 stop:501 length:396 start_codon:yes stop_codon:yes gene_type:complete
MEQETHTKLHGRYSGCACPEVQANRGYSDTEWRAALSVDQIAQILGISYSTARRNIKKNRFYSISTSPYYGRESAFHTNRLDRLEQTPFVVKLQEALERVNADQELVDHFNSTASMYRMTHDGKRAAGLMN